MAGTDSLNSERYRFAVDAYWMKRVGLWDKQKMELLVCGGDLNTVDVIG